VRDPLTVDVHPGSDPTFRSEGKIKHERTVLWYDQTKQSKLRNATKVNPKLRNSVRKNNKHMKNKEK